MNMFGGSEGLSRRLRTEIEAPNHTIYTEERNMKTKIFIAGSEGTTGLRIHERFQGRDDIELLKIDPELRKDPNERKRLINESDITFLCLPDDAARESVSLVENENVVIIDTSTAHRTEEGWSYGFPELSATHKEKIISGKRIAVPGCYATGFISLVYPLIASGIMPKDYPVNCFGISGYSGAGKKAIAVYEGEDKPVEHNSGRIYALTQQHKHLKEMQKITGLERTPLFTPIIDDYYSGMVVSIQIYTDMLNKKETVLSLLNFYADYYKNQPFIKVASADDEVVASGFIAGNGMSGWDGLKIYVTGNDDRIVISSQFDNLGKGASGAAVECMNLVLGCEATKGLSI